MKYIERNIDCNNVEKRVECLRREIAANISLVNNYYCEEKCRFWQDVYAKVNNESFLGKENLESIKAIAFEFSEMLGLHIEDPTTEDFEYLCSEYQDIKVRLKGEIEKL